MRRTIIFLLICIFSNSFLFAQIENYRAQYPDEDVVTVLLEKQIKIRESNGKLYITQHVFKQNAFLTTEGFKHSEDKIGHDTFNSIKEVRAATQNTINGKPKYTEVTDFEDKDVLIRGIFYNDQKQRKVIFPNVRNNSLTNLEYTLNINDPHFIPSFIFWSEIPILKAKVSISFPDNVKVAYQELNLESDGVSFEKRVENNATTYTWTLNHIPKISRHYDFSPLYYIPQIITYINSYEHKGRTIPVLNDVEDLYQWYASLISGINKKDQKTLYEITNDLVKDAETEEEKIKNIYYFVQDKINYIAFEDGLNGFIPRDAINVYKNKYGDCKDMANILNEMLGYAGIDSHLTWIGTRRKPYSYNDVPTPVADNHMITAVITKDNDTLFLDATAKYLPYGYPSPFTQGKEGLIGLSPSHSVVQKVPTVAAHKNTLHISSELYLEDDNLFGKHNALIRGYEKLEMMHKLENKDQEDLDFLHRALKYGTEQTTFKNIDYKHLQRLKDTLEVAFETETERYVRKINNKIYIKPHLDFFLMDELVKDEQKSYDKKIDFKSKKTFHTVLEIPEGYEVDFLPKDDSFDHGDFEYVITFEKEDGQIVIDKEVIVNTLKVNPKTIPDWNSFIKSSLKSNKKTIVLKPKT